MTTDDVKGFNAVDKVVNYFLKGIEKILENIMMFRIKSCRLLEIHQSDLKPFTKLVFINLGNNEIKILEKGLFDFNLDLQVVGFESNKIVHIDSNIFDNLLNLDHFWFEENPCIDIGADIRSGAIDLVLKLLILRKLNVLRI